MVIQTSATGLLVLPFLLVGLLSFPTFCRCGAEMPHSHSLFMLGNHHHGHSHHGDVTEQEQTSLSVDQQGPQLRVPAITTSPGKHVATLPGGTAGWTGQLATLHPWLSTLLAAGRIVTPESPPPRPGNAF